MLPTFVIGLREGLGASLIVGSIAAFLRRQGRPSVLQWMWLGVPLAVAIRAAAFVGVSIVARDLPQRGQEGREKR